MLPVVTPLEMAAIDAAAPEPVEVLIQRAGASVAREALRLLGGAYGRRVVVLAGKGNNGADGRAAATHLTRRGARVQIVDALDAPAALPPSDLVIDAAYGTGFHGTYDAPRSSGAPVLAVDIPSGVDGATGQPAGEVLAAARTVTFAALKPGLVLEPGRSLAGEVVVADIGLDTGSAQAYVLEGTDVASWLPARTPTAHKWASAVLIVAGSAGMTGAARLAAAAAQRAGAGMVRVGSPGVPDDRGRPLEAVGLALPATAWAATAAAEADRFTALVVGPGLGRADTTRSEVRSLLATVELPAVIDGDALVALGSDAAAVLGARSAGAVLTPHDGEFEALTGARPGADRLASARALAHSSGAVVVLKGAVTVVAEPGGAVHLVTGGDARLATAGTGDVLSGIIGALLARGMAPLVAASAGAWLHASAAARGAASGLVAGDLPGLLVGALAALPVPSSPSGGAT